MGMWIADVHNMHKYLGYNGRHLYNSGYASTCQWVLHILCIFNIIPFPANVNSRWYAVRFIIQVARYAVNSWWNMYPYVCYECMICYVCRGMKTQMIMNIYLMNLIITICSDIYLFHHR